MNQVVRTDLFRDETPEEAWLIGIIWADGCLTARGNPGTIKLTSTDREIASECARIIGANVWPDGIPRGNRKQSYATGFTGAPVQRLIDIGLVHRKSLNGPMADLSGEQTVPFIRGYFDGNGSVGLYVNPSKVVRTPRLVSSFTGPLLVMQGIQAHLSTLAGLPINKIGRNGRVYDLQYNHKDSLMLADLMYGAPGPCLSRKRAIFDEGRRIAPIHSSAA